MRKFQYATRYAMSTRSRRIEAHRETVLALHEARRDITLDELRRELGQVGVSVAISTLHVSARRGDEQNRWLAYTAIGGILVGSVLRAAIDGALARATPDSWRWPERMAARALGGTEWDGARRLASSNPESWNRMVTGAVIGQGNEAALERCQRAANKADEPVRCTVRVRPEERR